VLVINTRNTQNRLQPLEGVYYALLQPFTCKNEAKRTAASPRPSPTPSIYIAVYPAAASCLKAGSCVSLRPNTSLIAERVHASSFPFRESSHKKAIKKITPVGARVAQDKYANDA